LRTWILMRVFGFYIRVKTSFPSRQGSLCKSLWLGAKVFKSPENLKQKPLYRSIHMETESEKNFKVLQGSNETEIKVTLVVSAWLPEQVYLRSRLGQRQDVLFELIGMGPLQAASRLTSVLHSLEARGISLQKVCFVGTAGAYDTSVHPLLSAFCSTQACFTDGCAAQEQSYFPGEESQRKGQWFDSLDTPQREVSVVCPPSITLQNQVAKALATLGQLENLEVAAVASVCKEQGSVPWVCYLGVSNEVGSKAHEQWRAYHEKASQAAAELMLADFLRK
jgi:hypothetical protein